MDPRAFAVVAILSAGVTAPAVPAATAPSINSASRTTVTTIRRDGAELRFQRQPSTATRTAVRTNATIRSAVRANASAAKARFDLDGDGLDEIVSGAYLTNPDVTAEVTALSSSTRPARTATI